VNIYCVVTTKQADRDIEAAIEHYINQGAAEAAAGLINALEKAMGLISEHPHLGSPRFAVETNMPEIRGFALQRFPYIIFYTEHYETVMVHRVLHTARDVPSRFIED
jgi:toxin ParE1/3/4